jgi:hypothetical protein
MTDEQKIAALELKLKLATDTLEFYAHGKTWEFNYYGGTCKAQVDQGRKAVEALKEIKK